MSSLKSTESWLFVTLFFYCGHSLGHSVDIFFDVVDIQPRINTKYLHLLVGPVLAAGLSSIVSVTHVQNGWETHDERVKPVCLTGCPGDPLIEFTAGIYGSEFP